MYDAGIQDTGYFKKKGLVTGMGGGGTSEVLVIYFLDLGGGLSGCIHWNFLEL